MVRKAVPAGDTAAAAALAADAEIFSPLTAQFTFRGRGEIGQLPGAGGGDPGVRPRRRDGSGTALDRVKR